MKKIIDLAHGAKIIGRDEMEAEKILKYFMTLLPDMREELHTAYVGRASDPVKFRFMVDKFYGGVVYVGAPALCDATNDLLVALYKKEEQGMDGLYQQVLNEMSALEEKMAEKS
jgi:hypothetical protein